jgi:hypothetical protein
VFAEAVIWQNRSAYRTAVAKIAGAGAGSGSKRRRREGVVAGYWQRYCAKNDTVGFFGPLAWGEVRDDGWSFRHATGSSFTGAEVSTRSTEPAEVLAAPIDIPGPMFLSALRTFQPFLGDRPTDHWLHRVVAGDMGARRRDRPAEAAGIRALARTLGLPRRVFAMATGFALPGLRGPGEPGPGAQPAPDQGLRRSGRPERLGSLQRARPPRPMLAEDDKGRYTRELRIVAVDRTRRGTDASARLTIASPSSIVRAQTAIATRMSLSDGSRGLISPGYPWHYECH